ncbi:MAG: bifunctional riboflavin kinase/FAD synthetase [Bacteroidales bacterium]|nr:bifunctional riboflavin kinase/FAD synthetase [Bacteroidales bacterium]
MIIHKDYRNLRIPDPFVTIGVFDGVHLGHQALLRQLVAAAREKGSESVVITFDPHPKHVLSQDNENLLFLTTLTEKGKLLEKLMVDHLIVINFTKDLGNIEARDFIRDVLVKSIGIKHLLVGYNNQFGKARGGDISKIREYARVYGFTVDQAEGVSGEEGIISSTAIREALLSGDLANANKWLGYSYQVTGKVVEGKKLGRSLGFPTANIKPDEDLKLIPANGVYAVEVLIENELRQGVLSIGYNPTVDPGRKTRSIEVNIFDFEDDLYGKSVTVFFRYRLRDEKRFENTDQLRKQMAHDRDEALKLLV